MVRAQWRKRRDREVLEKVKDTREEGDVGVEDEGCRGGMGC